MTKIMKNYKRVLPTKMMMKIKIRKIKNMKKNVTIKKIHNQGLNRSRIRKNLIKNKDKVRNKVRNKVRD
jgi:hypothetical protein